MPADVSHVSKLRTTYLRLVRHSVIPPLSFAIRSNAIQKNAQGVSFLSRWRVRSARGDRPPSLPRVGNNRRGFESRSNRRHAPSMESVDSRPGSPSVVAAPDLPRGAGPGSTDRSGSVGGPAVPKRSTKVTFTNYNRFKTILLIALRLRTTTRRYILCTTRVQFSRASARRSAVPPANSGCEPRSPNSRVRAILISLCLSLCGHVCVRVYACVRVYIDSCTVIGVRALRCLSVS